MRQISADLTAVQLVRSPRARVSVTVEARGQNPDAPAVAWSELVSNAAQTTGTLKPTAAVGLANGNILKFVAESGRINQYTVTAPKTAAPSNTGSYPTALPCRHQDTPQTKPTTST